MKKLFFALALLPLATMAQDSASSKKPEIDTRPTGKTLVKMNLSSLALKNYHFTLERGINKKMSIALSYRFMPTGNLPIESIVENMIDNPDVQVDRFTIGNHAITPEFKYYLGKGTLHGFYLSAYARFASFEVSVPVRYQNGSTKETVDIAGKIKSTSGGVMLGSQFNLGKHMVLDIWILGAHFGGSSGTLNGSFKTTLSQADQKALYETLKNTNTNPFSFDYTVTANNVKVDASGPWAGVRAAGVNFGFRF